MKTYTKEDIDKTYKKGYQKALIEFGVWLGTMQKIKSKYERQKFKELQIRQELYMFTGVY